MEKKNFTVLLVDDDAETRLVYGEFLRNEFEVTEAVDGLDALEKINQEKPDLVLTGIIMPRMDGFGLAEALKQNITTAALPVVFLSHLGREEDEKRARETGVKDFILRDTTTPKEVIARLHAVFSAKEYVIGIDPFSLDAAKLAEDFNLNPDFICSEGAEGKLALRLRLKDSESKRFDAEIICV